MVFPWNSLARQLAIAAMRPTISPPRSATNSATSACWWKGCFSRSRRALKTIRSGGTHWGSRALIFQERSMKGLTGSPRPISRIAGAVPGRLADAELAADPCEGIEDPVELVGGVRGHHGGAQPAGALGDRGR